MTNPVSLTSTRRRFLTRAGAVACAAPLASCASPERYESAVTETWRPFAAHLTDRGALVRELVRYATLAPSSHNTQSWKFTVKDDLITILPDFARRCPAVDPDDHHLFVGLGCATENVVLAARAHGLHADVRFDATGDGAVRIALAPAKTVVSPLFDAIVTRQCTRAAYDGRALSAAESSTLAAAGTASGVRVLMLSGRTHIEHVLDYVVDGNTVQMNDVAFMNELRSWIRFNAGDAVATGDGLSSMTSGSPQVPSWVGNLAFKLAFTPKSENDKYARFMRSSAGVAVFVADHNDPEHWVAVGRCYQRFVLQATALGIRTAMVNQPVEVPAVRGDFARMLGIATQRPDLVVRFGRGPRMPQSLRRPVDAVLV